MLCIAVLLSLSIAYGIAILFGPYFAQSLMQ